LAWLPSSLLILLYLLSTPKRAGQAASDYPCEAAETRADGHYSQGARRTQGKIAKKAGKMQIFGEAVEKSVQECGFGAFAGFEPSGEGRHGR